MMDLTRRLSISFPERSFAANGSFSPIPHERTLAQQRERKRESNRNAQRMKRERTKKRIEELEMLVKQLSQSQQQSQSTDTLSKQVENQTMFGDALSGLKMQLSHVQEETNIVAASMAQFRALEDAATISSHEPLSNIEATPSLTPMFR
jgi:hypothetical protein